ncbi:tRNA (guanine-N1)-methyltransferase [Thermophagus sp. OGC60D27]|uniref:tRNA (guanine-N1)-methyltransferase n=1 Tax=Thermophagus sp. OGC60D27 TaxID=3458415 RepID=UPI0040379725
MKTYSFFIILFTTFLWINSSIAQNKEEATLDNGDISGQFDYTITKSSKYEEYRVVRTAWLYKLKNNVLDSLKLLHDKTYTLETTIDSLNNHIADLKDNLETTQKKLDDTVRSKNSIPFMGAEIQKEKYNTIMWSLVFILIAGAAFLFLLFKRSNYTTKQMQEKYSDLEKEFEAHRQRVLEKEKRIARQHLNELNKLRGRQ